MEFPVQAWNPCLKKDIECLEKIQHRATKNVPDLRNLEYNERLKALNLTTLEERRERGSSDPFKEQVEDGTASGKDSLIHIRIQQRNGRKTLTTVQGLSKDYDLRKIVKVCKKDFACNGTVVEHPEYGEVIQLQGDQRSHIKEFLKKVGLAKEEQLKVHGF